MFLLGVFVRAQAQQEGVETETFRSAFRYVLIGRESEIEQYVNRLPEDFLSLEVLMDDKTFNEKNLKTLSELLSRRYATAQSLNVYIYTSLDAIKTPEENDRSNLKGPVDNYFKFKRAEFTRNAFGNEWFQYWIPKSVDGKVVVLKGCYIKCK